MRFGAGDGMRIVLERRPDCPAIGCNAADQDSRCDQVADKHVLRCQLDRNGTGGMARRVKHLPIDVNSPIRK
jgi:hypothetical protein